MNLLRSIFLTCCMLALLDAQAQLGDLRTDRDFFNKQAQAYQKWLEYSGLGTTLHVYTLDVQADRLSLYLAFPYQDTDSIIAAWSLLKNAWERSHPTTLEQALFYKATHLMEVRQSLLNVQLYDTYDTRREPLFMRGIYFDTDSGRVAVETNDPKSQTREIKLTPPQTAQGNPAAVAELQKRLSQEEVFRRIEAYAHLRYENNVCKDRDPKVNVLESGDQLRFEAEDLCREVLTDEANPMLAELLRPFGYDINWVKRELLTFTISYETTASGIKLSVTIDGLYGSGIYAQVQRGAYMNMEPEFEAYLKRYADLFKESLKKELLRP